MVKPRWTKPDANQNDIVKALVRIPGLDIIDLHDLGISDVPDILIGFMHHNYLVEIKTDEGKLSPGQMYFQDQWPGQKAVARNLDDVLKIIGLAR